MTDLTRAALIDGYNFMSDPTTRTVVAMWGFPYAREVGPADSDPVTNERLLRIMHRGCE